MNVFERNCPEKMIYIKPVMYFARIFFYEEIPYTYTATFWLSAANYWNCALELNLFSSFETSLLFWACSNGRIPIRSKSKLIELSNDMKTTHILSVNRDIKRESRCSSTLSASMLVYNISGDRGSIFCVKTIMHFVSWISIWSNVLFS